MSEIVQRELGLTMCAFRPSHARRLSNEFRCYSNFEDPILQQENPANH